ncbi:MAG: outer membrane lipoprotein carrier protein LolA [Pseudomonadota bacterium]
MTMLNHLIFKRPTRIVAAGIAGVVAFAIPAGSPLAPVAAAHAQPGAVDLDQAVQALRSISTMRASFTQTDRMGNTARGTMTLKRPGKIRFDYGEDSDLLVISNGKSLYLVDYEVNQVERWPIKSSPLGALLDPNRDVKQYGTMVPTGSPDVLSVEVRDPKKPEFGMMNMILVRDAAAPGGWQLTHWVALDAQNHRTTVRLSNHRYGVSVAESTFQFRDPRRSSRRPR